MKKLVLIFFIISVSIYAFSEETYLFDDSLDDLFSDPIEDVVEEKTPETNVLEQLDKNNIVTVSGSFGGLLGTGFGLVEPLKGFNNENFKYFLGASGNASISVDARPHHSIRIFGTIDSKITKDNITNPWNGISISTLATEYNINKTAFFTFGKFATSVGGGFISKSTGTSLKIAFPTVLSGINILINADSSSLVSGEFDPARLFYGTWGDVVFGPTRLSAGFKFQYNGENPTNEQFGLFFGLYTGLWDLNLTTELTYSFIPEHHLAANTSIYYINGNINIGGIYSISAYVSGQNRKDTLEQHIQLAFRYANIFDSPYNFDILATVNPEYLSGYIVPAVSFSPAKYITIAVALPYCYGEKGLEILGSDLDSKYAVTIDTRLTLVTSISLKVDL